MKVLRTTNCSRYAHPEFRLAYDPSTVPVEEDLRWFIGWLEESVAKGSRFADGETCQVGWSVTQVRQREDGDLSLWESDMRHMPIVWTESVSHTLAHLRIQKDVVESVLRAEDLSFPSMQESAIICNRLGQGTGLVMERTEPAGSDSGWFCGCAEEGHDHNDAAELQCVSLYEAAIRHSAQIIPYLALPSGILVSIGDGAPVLFRDGKPLEYKAQSFLAAKYPNR